MYYLPSGHIYRYIKETIPIYSLLVSLGMKSQLLVVVFLLKVA